MMMIVLKGISACRSRSLLELFSSSDDHLFAMEHSQMLTEESGGELQPHPTKSFVGKYARVSIGAAILVSVGYIGGQHSSAQSMSLMGLQTKPAYSMNQFTTQFGSWSNGYTCPTLTKYIAQISGATAAAITPANTQANGFKTWWAGVLPAEQKAAEAIMNTKMTEVCSPPPPANPVAKAAPAAAGSVKSYTEFGHVYSSETAGKPWSEITRIDDIVRKTAAAPVGASAVVLELKSWYHNHLTTLEKKDFDNNAVTHMLSSSR